MAVARLERERGRRRALRVDDRHRRDAGVQRRPGLEVRRLAGRTRGRPTRSSPAAAAGRRRSPGREHQPAAAEPPGRARPVAVGRERQHPAGRLGDVGVELGHERALGSSAPSGRGPVRAADLVGQRGERVLVGRDAAARSGRPRTGGDARGRAPRRASTAPRGRHPARPTGRRAGPGPSTAARRRCATGARCSSGAAARPGTTCPGRGAPPRRRRSAARSRSASSLASSRLLGPSASVFHCGAGRVVERDERRLAAHREAHVAASSRSSTASPSASMRAHCCVGVGRVTRGSSWTRRTSLRKREGHLDRLGRARDRRGAAGVRGRASGMWPSPANSAHVGSRPIQPAPGT